MKAIPIVATALILPMIATASEVTLTSHDGDTTLVGELLRANEEAYILKTDIGEMAVARKSVSCSGEACPKPVNFRFGGEVELNAPDGSIRLTGTLIGADDVNYTLQTVTGVMRVERSKVICQGDGCPGEQPAAPTAAVVATTADLLVRGSDTIGEVLMPKLVEGYAATLGGKLAETTPFNENFTAFTFSGPAKGSFRAEVQAAGSSTGIKALINGKTDIAMASRPAKEAEIAAIAAQGRGDLESIKQEFIVGVDSILVVTHPNNPVYQLTLQQVGEVFAGRITNWAQLGGQNAPIRLYTRPAGSGTRGVFSKQTVERVGAEISSRAIVKNTNEEIAHAIEEDPNGIGYVGYAYRGNTKSLDMVSSCGIPFQANAFAVKAEEYPLQRRLRLFVDNSPKSTHEQGLLNFASSSKADPHVRASGFIDLGVVLDDGSLGLSRTKGLLSVTPDMSALPRATKDMMPYLPTARRLSTAFRFRVGSAQLDNRAERDLARVVEFLAKPENAGRTALVMGYTDSVGSFSSNLRLSQVRAAAVAEALNQTARNQIGKALPVEIAGFGELSPIGCNDDAKGRESNRRVEIWLK